MAVSVLAGRIWISITGSGRCSTRTRGQAEVAKSVVLLLQMFYRIQLLLKHTNTNCSITLLTTVCQTSHECRTLHSDNFNEHPRRIYFVTDSCSAERQCFSCTVYKLAYLLTYYQLISMCILNVTMSKKWWQYRVHKWFYVWRLVAWNWTSLRLKLHYLPVPPIFKQVKRCRRLAT